MIAADRIRQVADQPVLIDRLAETMHDAYEDAALKTGWQTQAESRKPWVLVPEANKATMRVAIVAMLNELADLQELY